MPDDLAADDELHEVPTGVYPGARPATSPVPDEDVRTRIYPSRPTARLAPEEDELRTRLYPGAPPTAPRRLEDHELRTRAFRPPPPAAGTARDGDATRPVVCKSALSAPCAPEVDRLETRRTRRGAGKKVPVWARLKGALATAPWKVTSAIVVTSGLFGASAATLAVSRADAHAVQGAPVSPVGPVGAVGATGAGDGGTGGAPREGATRSDRIPLHAAMRSPDAPEARAAAAPRPLAATPPPSPTPLPSARARKKEAVATASPSAVARPTPADPAGSARPCRLKLNSFPVASVTLDGKPIGDTPRANVLTAPGDHRAVFSSGPREKVVTFRCSEDEETALAVRLNPGSADVLP